MQYQTDTGPIFHTVFFGNPSGTPKFEPQSAHFPKQLSLLHYTVKYDCNKEIEKLSYS